MVLSVLLAGCLCCSTGGAGDLEGAASKISSRLDRVSALAMAKGDPGVCDELRDSLDWDFCIQGVSVVLEDESLCNNVEDSEYRFWCAMNLAEKTNDVGVCQRLLTGDVEGLSICNGIVRGTEESCNGVTDELYKWECLAMVKDDISYCNNIPLEDRFDCHREAALKSNNRKYCDAISDSVERSWCLTRVAEKTMDSKLCDNIGDGDWKKYCMGVESGNSDYCMQIKDKKLADECLYNLVKIKSGYFKDGYEENSWY